jgi:hypothetical protein
VGNIHVVGSFLDVVRCCLLVVGRSLCVIGLLSTCSSIVVRLLLVVAAYSGYNLVVVTKNPVIKPRSSP